ncbi:MAG TPA: hypothetical protein VMU45_01020 [Candidatus Eisenbacteria bacterium]|nr:hypothetical protein [Candidatus Eisenbacteria bacterium]
MVRNLTPPSAASELTRLAEAEFTGEPPFSKCERLLLEKAPVGQSVDCLPDSGAQPGWDDPANAGTWGPERSLRSRLLAWLCADRVAAKLVHWRGIRVHGANISGPLDLEFADVPFRLALLHCRVDSSVDLSTSKVAHLDFSGSHVNDILADGITVKYDALFAEGFHASGGVRLRGAQIGGILDCVGGIFFPASPAGSQEKASALDANGIIVLGDVLLREGFVANGEVDLIGAQISGDLDCSGGKFSGATDSLSAQRCVVRGSMFLRDGFKSVGNVNLANASVGGVLAFRKGEFGGTLNLTDVSAGMYKDAGALWPTGGKLTLDGFTYGRISNDERIDVAQRLTWLSLQPATTFRPQPYVQLARILRDSGDASGAKRVLAKMERLRRKSANDSPVHRTWHWVPDPLGRAWNFLLRYIRRAWNWVLWLLIGYGYYPGRAGWALVALWLIGWWLYSAGYRAGVMVPTDKQIFAEFKLWGVLPEDFPRFSASIYSLENSLPLVKFDQAAKWQPDPKPKINTTSGQGTWHRYLTLGWSLIWFLRLQIAGGWFLATMIVAGVSGVVHKE